MSVLSDRLKELRLKHKYTQKQIGDVLGCAYRYYQKIEYGEIKPNYEVLSKLADHFDVSLDYLVGRSDNPKRH